jgi:hypothetical protein
LAEQGIVSPATAESVVAAPAADDVVARAAADVVSAAITPKSTIFVGAITAGAVIPITQQPLERSSQGTLLFGGWLEAERSE